MIELHELLSLALLKKSQFTGSYHGMRYLLEKKTIQEDGDRECLSAAVWPEPYSYAATEEEEKQYKIVPFDSQGLDQAIAWLNESFENQKEMWESKK